MHPGRIAAAVVLSLAQIACSNPQEKAREKLGQMNIKYNEDTFVERDKDGDKSLPSQGQDQADRDQQDTSDDIDGDRTTEY